jgi:hypothetical protein
LETIENVVIFERNDRREQGDAASDLLFAALQTMLSHGSEYLRTIDLGRLSNCPKTTSLMMT